uniref:Uncharacterized protein n=1 Tax=Populus alba TaxID=43335 RepID=A0A4U5Q7F2_POPAL|nr:hypothetical protein D5086_0000129850 [Populus alba]
MAKNKKKTTSSRRSPVRGSSPDKYLICPEKNEVIVAEKAISLSTADHVLVEDCSDCDAFEEDEVDYSISEYASGGSSKFFRSPTPIPAIGKLDLPSGEELVAPPPQPLGDSGKSASNAAPPAQHASSPGKSPVPAPSKWRDLFSSKQNPDVCPKLLHYSEISTIKTCTLLNDDLTSHSDYWNLCIVGFVAGKFPGYKALSSIISNSWHCEAKLTIHESGWLVYQFQNVDDKLAVLAEGPYSVYGRPLLLQPMSEFFDFSAENMTTVPVWVRFPNLPLKCWSIQGLSKIASVLGKPLQSDKFTATMERLSFARVLIELDLLDDLPSSIPICLPNDTTLNQSVVYETLPKVCKHCRVLGHSSGACTKFSIPVDADKEGLSNKAGLPTGPSQERRVSALQRLGKVLQTNKEHDKEHAEAAHTKKGNDKGQPEVIRNNMGNDKGKTVVGDTCLDPMHMEADEWETVRGKHTKKLLSPRGNNVQGVTCRGLNSPLKQHEAVSLMKRKKIDVYCFVETKLASSRVGLMHNFRLKSWNFTASFVYGFNTISLRRSLWDDLRRWSPNTPWLVLADFNSVLSQEDKHSGAPVTSYEITDFRECCSDLGLAYLNSTGCLYTWSNGHVWSKIDRVMVNTHWSTLQQQAQVHFDNPGAFSDHSPSYIQIGSRQPCRNRNFKFFNMWADHPQFLELIEQCWNTPVYGSYMFTLCRKLKLLKRPLKELNKLHYSHISQRVTRAEEELDSPFLHQDCDNIHLQSQVKHFRSQLVYLKSAEQSYYGQKLKFTFLKEADKGTRFFHAMLSQKHRRNHIPAIQVPSGTYSSSVDEVGDEFVRYFTNLLGSTKQTDPINEDVIQCGPCIDTASHDQLLGPVTDDLIQQTPFSIGNEKAPGPDGFSSLFFKKAWSIVGGDFCAAVKDFFTSGLLLKQVNHSVIALVPKSSNVNLAADFRPISCCNVIYMYCCLWASLLGLSQVKDFFTCIAVFGLPSSVCPAPYAMC